MARKLFGEGALTAAFVPVFKGEVEAQAMESARRLARSVLTMSLLMLGAIVALAFLGLETAVHFRIGLEMTGRTLLTVRLVKTLLPYMIFICGAAFGMGVLNAMGRFKASSAMPLRSANGLPFLPAYINAFMSLKVEQYVDLDTHGMFICSVTEAQVLSKADTMTYTYYQNNVKPKPETEGKKGWVCKICGYVYEGDALPDDFICPLCKHPASDFEPIQS